MLTVRPLGPELLPDFLAFFDRDAFADNPKWGSCYCHFPHADHAKVVWHERTGVDNRLASSTLICDGRMQGWLAYADGRPIGWCNAGPRPLIDGLFGEADPEGGRIGAIACFVIAPPWRRKGVASALLNAACEGFAARGLEWAEAYPLTGEQTAAQHHFGPLEMYRHAGFEVHREEADRVCVRKRLEPRAES